MSTSQTTTEAASVSSRSKQEHVVQPPVPSKSPSALAHPPHGSGSPDGVAFLGSAGDR